MVTPYDRRAAREKRHRRVRRRVFGTPERPRLTVFRSNRHIYAQLVDDDAGRTLAAASTVEAEIRERTRDMRPLEAARVVGEAAAQRALAKGIRKAVFDRGGYLYHGCVAALAEGARGAGLEF
ncbi:MAG: 50S ribosomal protein L18 [Firmicutes bacterium]|nr:50S ribosomal protein L18 [Bacillota bacterium]